MNTTSKSRADRSFGQRLNRFFYAEEIPYGVALVRIMLPLVLLITIVHRWPHARELYSADGAAAPLAENYGFYNFLPELSGTTAVALFTALVFFLVMSAVGWCTRVSLIAVTILYTYFTLMDSLSSVTKYTVIASHMLFLLSLSPCGRIWSVDSWLMHRRAKLAGADTRLPVGRLRPVWSRRLIQLLIGMVYFGAAVTKMHTPEYFSGDQLQYWMMTNVNWPNPVGEYFSLFPASLVVFSYVAVVWEVTFVFLAWHGVGRVVMLALGLLFHLMTTFLLGLYIFPLVCWCSYFAFVDGRDVRRIKRFLQRQNLFPSRWTASLLRGWSLPQAIPTWLRLPSPAAFGLLMMVVTSAGTAIEYQSDVYKTRGPDGPLTLEEVDPDVVHHMLNGDVPIRNKDKFMSFHTGTVFIGGILANRRNQVHYGEPIYAQCALNPPHEDIWVECNLHDAEDRLINRVGAIVPREMYRYDFVYRLNESIEPGEYFLVLSAAGEEVSRQKITLLPKLTASAN